MGEYLSHKIEAAQRLLLGNSLTDWLVAGIVAVAVWSGLWILRRLAASRYQKDPGAQHSLPVPLVTYLIGNTTQLLFLGAALYPAQERLTLPDTLPHPLTYTPLILFLPHSCPWSHLPPRPSP